MMARTAAPRDDHAWEKEKAPKIGRPRMILAIAVYLVWIGILVSFGAVRWFGALH